MSDIQREWHPDPNSVFGLEISVPDLPISLQEALDLRPGMSIQVEGEEQLRAVLKVDGVGIASGTLKLVDGQITVRIKEILY